MVNSNVPHLRSLVSVSCIEIIVQVRILNLSSVRSNEHMMALLSALCERSDYKLVHLNFRSYKGETVKLQSAVKDDYNNFQEKSNKYHISEPIIGRSYPNLHFGAVHCFILLRKETLQNFARFWRLFRSVMWSRSILVLFYLGVSPSHFFSFFVLWQLVIAFLIIKTIILLGLAGYQIIITILALRTLLPGPLSYPARPSCTQICVYPRPFRVARFSLKMAHLSFSMGPGGTRAYGLRPRYGSFWESYSMLFVGQVKGQQSIFFVFSKLELHCCCQN